MRQMVDALHWDFPEPCPADTDPSIIVAAYVNHPDNLLSTQQAQTRFPRNRIVSINSDADADANILDVENGAVSPNNMTTIRNWVDKQRVDLKINPTIYMNESTWPQIKAYFDQTLPPEWWVAHWDGQPAPIPTGAIGKQYSGDGGRYDISSVVDYWPGVDSVPSFKGEEVQLYNTSQGVFFRDANGYYAGLSSVADVQALEAAGYIGANAAAQISDTLHSTFKARSAELTGLAVTGTISGTITGGN